MSIDPSVDYINQTVTNASVVNMNATGQAYQGVANSMALAVENTSSNLANFSTIVQAGMAKALEEYMVTQSETWVTVIAELQALLLTQASTLKTVGQDAGTVMAVFGSLTQQKFSEVLEHSKETSSSSTPPKARPVHTSSPASTPTASSGPSSASPTAPEVTHEITPPASSPAQG